MSEVEAILERLVAQFSSPYDFLRELVQNAMDAGSDRVEIVLDVHPFGDRDEVVFELQVVDTGKGMDEVTIDGELTRLFASGKAEDRTMAGGFGIGFVSVFAWEPEVVLLQTGRGGEAWELTFHADRTFDKSRLSSLVEGTAVTLFRRGRAGERAAIAEAVRDTLWRWCRFAPLEVTFEDRPAGEPVELVQDSPDPPPDALTGHQVDGDTQVRVSFGVPASVVLMRRGLILAEGVPSQLLSGIAPQLGRGASHLQVWADSPLLRTTMSRDRVVDDDGRRQIERRILAVRDTLRREVLDRLETLAAAASPWTARNHRVYAHHQAHLCLELIPEQGPPDRMLLDRPLFRRAGQPGAIELRRALAWSHGRALLVSAVDLDERASSAERELLALATAAGVPVLAADPDEDRSWLAPLAAAAGGRVLPLSRALARVEPRPDEARGLCGLVEQLLRAAGLRGVEVRAGRVGSADAERPLFGVHVGADPAPLAFHGGGDLPAESCRDHVLWVDLEDLLVEAAVRTFARTPLVAAMTVALAMLGRIRGGPSPSDLSDAAQGLRRPG